MTDKTIFFSRTFFNLTESIFSFIDDLHTKNTPAQSVNGKAQHTGYEYQITLYGESADTKAHVNVLL